MIVALVIVAGLLGSGLACAQTTSMSIPTIESVWSAVNDTHYNRSFDRSAWQLLRPQATQLDHASREQAYAAIRSLLNALQDPAVRFLEPEQNAAFMREISGAAHAGVGLAEMLSIDISTLPSPRKGSIRRNPQSAFTRRKAGCRRVRLCSCSPKDDALEPSRYGNAVTGSVQTGRYRCLRRAERTRFSSTR